VLGWTGDTYARYRVPVANGTHFVVVNDIGTDGDEYPNSASGLPSIGTGVTIGIGTEAFQEKDLSVAITRVLKGNRYEDDGHFDSLGGDTLPESLMYAAKPTWISDQETEFSTTFNLQAFDPVTPSPASASNIPAGYRFFLLVDPAKVSVGINTAGTELSLGLNKPCQIGAGGNGGLTLSGGITATYNRISGSAIIYTLSRAVQEGEVVTATYTQPGNGIEAVSNGNDLPSFSGSAVTNASSVVTGVVHVGPDTATMTADYSYADSSLVLLQKIPMTVTGQAVAIRWYVVSQAYAPSVRAVLTDINGTKLSASSANGTVTGSERWQSIAITSQPVTGGTNYLAGVQFLANFDPVMREMTGAAAGSSYEATHAFASAFPSSFTLDGGHTVEYAIQVRVIADPPTPHHTPRAAAGVISRRR